MRVLIAGGVFRLSPKDLERRQPAPEVVLAEGLRARGIDVRTCRLEDKRTIATMRDCDVVHVNHLSKGAVAAAVSPLARPFVFTEHATGRGRQLLTRTAQRLVMARASAVVCLSREEAKQKITAYSLPPSRIEVIPNGISTSPDLCQQRSRSTDGPMVLLFVGQLVPFKQLHRIITALSELPDNVVLRLVYHNDADLMTLRASAEALGVGSRVTFVGQRNGAALTAEYRAAHLLVLPSRSPECLPSVVTEALLTGLPVLASNVGGVPTQVGDAGLLVSASSEESLVPSIAKIMSDYPAFAARAFARAASMADEYSVDQMIGRHLDLYRRLSDGRHR